MTPYARSPEVEMPKEPLSRMASLIFDDRSAAVRGSLQVVIAVLIGALMGNTLNAML